MRGLIFTGTTSTIDFSEAERQLVTGALQVVPVEQLLSRTDNGLEGEGWREVCRIRFGTVACEYFRTGESLLYPHTHECPVGVATGVLPESPVPPERAHTKNIASFSPDVRTT